MTTPQGRDFAMPRVTPHMWRQKVQTHLDLLYTSPIFFHLYIAFFTNAKTKMADPNSLPLSRASVVAAYDLIKPYVHKTPVLTNTYISNLASTPRSSDELVNTPWEGQAPAHPKIRLWFKCENFQKIGAFKARGAFHALMRLTESEGWEANGGREKGVVTHSSGKNQHQQNMVNK